MNKPGSDLLRDYLIITYPHAINIILLLNLTSLISQKLEVLLALPRVGW